MIKRDDFENVMYHGAQKVYENEEAVMVYICEDYYMAVSKELKGEEYTYSGLYYNSTKGNFKRCKKAFEKYSPKTMKALQIN